MIAARRTGSYALKFAAAAGLAWLADWLFLFQWIGATLGYFALALLAAVALLRPATRRDKGGRIGLCAALAFALMLLEDPSLLAVVLYWSALAFAVLASRIARFDHALRWGIRLFIHAALIPLGPLADLRRWLRARRRRPGRRVSRLVPVLALPVLGSLVFLLLFASANPLIGDALAALDMGLIAGIISIPGTILWLLAFALCWAMLRPLAWGRLAPARESGAAMVLPGVTVESVTLSLLAFNALFALQNGLDLAFLWSGAPLPAGTTLAGYAHRGAYPLIATALLAGLFVLVTMRPGTPTAASRAIRRLVTLWTAQNVFLVASSILRTLDYIEAYSLTRLRIAALVWMALVALGLVLICLRLWRGKSDAWLINANAAAALLVLAGCSAVDLGRMAAAWNVRHARDAGGQGAVLDLCYLNTLGPSALLPITELEARTRDPELRERLAWSRNAMMDRMTPVLADWHGWTWRNDRRLTEAQRIVAERKMPRVRVEWRPCTGVARSPEPQAPLTAGPAR